MGVEGHNTRSEGALTGFITKRAEQMLVPAVDAVEHADSDRRIRAGGASAKLREREGWERHVASSLSGGLCYGSAQGRQQGR